MQQWLPFVNNSKLLQIPEDPFQNQSTGFKFTPTKRGFSPITEPVVSPILPSYTIYSISLLSILSFSMVHENFKSAATKSRILFLFLASLKTYGKIFFRWLA